MYKPVIKKFLGKDVRVVTVGTKEYIVLKDMFDMLGRVKKDGTWTDEKNKTLEFLEDIGKECDLEILGVSSKSKKSKSRKTQKVECLLIETAPMVLTQFRPINSNRRTQEENERVLNEWREFMKFVNELLIEAKAHEVILKDKEEQKRISDALTERTNCKMVIVNTQISRLMAELLGVYPHIKKLNKDDLKQYQPQITIDLIEVRQEAMNVFQQQYLLCEDYGIAYENTLKLMKMKYQLEIA